MAYKVSSELEKLFGRLIGAEKERIYSQIGEQLPHTFRFNTLKGGIESLTELLREQGFLFEKMQGLQNIFRIQHQPYPIGRSLSHFLGHIYVQDLASMIPPLVLNPQPNDWVLDMSAAPGSKTTQLAELMQNQGVILANDVVMKRIRSLTTNLTRMGIINTAVFRWKGERFGNQYFEKFDKVLLDPACTGLGTLHKSPEVLSWWTPKHCERMAALQKRLIESAVKALRPGGELCYSTCTLTPQENEEVIDFALKKFPVELEKVNIPVLKTRSGLTKFNGKPYNPELNRAARFYPFDNDSEGFFIAKLIKSDKIRRLSQKKKGEQHDISLLTSRRSPVKKYLDYLSVQFDIPLSVFSEYVYLFRRNIVLSSKEMINFPFLSRPIHAGLTVACPTDRGAKLTTEGTHFFYNSCGKNTIELHEVKSLDKFVNRDQMNIEVGGAGQKLVKYKGIMIGYGLVDSGLLKSQFPKAEWPFIIEIINGDPTRSD